MVVVRPSHKKIAKHFCCVTTRCRNFDRLGRLRLRCGTLTAQPLGLGVLDFDRFILPPPSLPLGRLPAPHQAQAFGILAIALVPAPRLVLLSTPFAQANPQPRSAAIPISLIMTLAHGSVLSQGTARGARANVLPGRFSSPQADSQSTLPDMNQTARKTL